MYMRFKINRQHRSRFLRTRILLLCVFTWIIGIIPAEASPAKDLTPVIAKLDAYIKKQVQNKVIPGCAIAIVYRNKVIFMNAYGVKTLGKPEKIDVDTVFQLGSVSKPIAATLAGILENQGHLKIDDPVSHYLPHFSLKSKQSPHSLKVKHVLSHSTGVPRGGFNNLIEAHAPYERIMTALQNTPVRTHVGKRYDYNNAMYSLISDITRSATQKSFHASLKTHLCQPLNMTKTSSTFAELQRSPNKATPHVRSGRRGLIPCDTYSKGYYSVAPAGGINSTIRDMAIFLNAQLGGYPQIISHKTLNRIHTPQITTTGSLSPSDGPPQMIKNPRYALGWRVVDFDHHRLVFHGGWLKGFTNFIAFMPEQQLGIVILHNSESKFSSKTAVKFFESYLDIPHQKRKVAHHFKPKKSKKTIKPPKKIKHPKTKKYSR